VTPVKFQVGVDPADPDSRLGDHLGQTDGLRPGERKVYAVRDSALKQIHVFRTAKY
jgi:hypothetical protein